MRASTRQRHVLSQWFWLMGTTALMAFCTSSPAVAQQGVQNKPPLTAQADARSFDIPAQPLSSALTAFGQQSGLQVTVDSALLAGLRSRPVSGAMTLDAALSQMLSGTGMTWHYSDARTVAIERQQGGGSGAVQLNPVTVEGRYRDATTDGTGSWTSAMSTIGGKVPTSIRETPQSVSVITRQRIEDQALTTVDQALREIPSISVEPNSNNFNPGFTSRGFDIGTQIDGMPVSNAISISTFDTAMYDRIEVLRGPAGLFQGQGQPGGAVNLVRKRPADEFRVSGAASYGSWDNYRGEADVGGPLNETGRVRYRFAGAAQDRDFYYDVVHQTKWFGYGVIEADLSDSTTLTLSGAAQDIDGTATWGQPRYTDGRFLPDRSMYVGAPWSHARTANYEGYVELEHKLGFDWIAEGSFRYMHSLWEQKILSSFGAGIDPATDTQVFNAYENPSKFNRWTGDLHVAGPVEILDRQHDLLFGISNSYYKAYDGKNGFATIGTFSIFDQSIPEPDLTLNPLDENRTEEFGAYGQARIRVLDPLTLVAGGRISTYKAYSRAPGADWVETQEERNVVTPYFGAVLDVTDTLSVYASYTDIFRPQTSQSPSGEILEPIVGKQYETGVKGEFLGGNVTAQAALFRIHDENRAQLIDGCAGSLCFEPAGKVQSEGVDLEISGSPSPGWTLYAGYVFTNSTYENGPTEGSQFATMTPRHSVRLWSTYNFRDGLFKDFTFGGGIRAVSATSDGDIRQTGYATVSATASYQLTDNLKLSLLANNIFDAVYYEKFSANGFFNWPGEPRSVLLTLRADY